MVGAAIAGAAVSLVGQGVASYLSAKSNAATEDIINQNYADSNAYYLSEMYADPTKRADNAAYLTQLQNSLKEQNKTNAATNRITGATQEAVIAQQSNASQAYADATSKLGALASQRRDSLGEAKLQNDGNYSNTMIGLENAKQENYANLASNAAEIGSSAISAWDGKTGLAGLKKTVADTTAKK